MWTRDERERGATGRSHRLRAAGVLVATCSLGCAGGQSGTDGNDQLGCDESETVEVGGEERINGSYTLVEALARLQGARTVRGRWLSTGDGTELTFEVGALTAAHRTSSFSGDVVCSSTFEIDTTVLVHTSDGVVDTTSPAKLSLAAPLYHALLEADVLVPEDHRRAAVWPPDDAKARQILGLDEAFRTTGEAPMLRTSLPLDDPGNDVTLGILDGTDILGLWSDTPGYRVSGPPADFMASGELAEACSGAEQFQSRTFDPGQFSTIDAAKQALSGTWIRCLDNAPTAHAGIRILPDGSFRHFELEGGDLVERPGFEREGYVGFIHDYPDPFMLVPFGRRFDSKLNDSGDFSGRPSDRALVFWSDVPEWAPAVYLPSSLSVRSVAPEFDDLERAGSAACDHGEQGIVQTIAEAAQLLQGEFVLCNGELTDGMSGLRFDGDEIELLDADGELIARTSFRLDDFNLPFIDAIIGNRQLTVAVSRRPLKVWLQEAALDGAYAPKAVFSAR